MGGGGVGRRGGGLITGLKKCFKTSYIEVPTKVHIFFHFEFDRFLKLQNVANN